MVGTNGNLQWLYDNRVTKISESVLSVVTASVTLSAIPGTYRHLYFDWYARGDVGATSTGTAGQLSADAGANYDWMQIASGGSGATSPAGVVGDTDFQFGDMTGNTAPASTFSAGHIELLNYAGTTGHKMGTWQTATKTAVAVANLSWYSGSFWWRSTAAVTSIKVFPKSGNFVAGSLFVVYGAN